MSRKIDVAVLAALAAVVATFGEGSAQDYGKRNGEHVHARSGHNRVAPTVLFHPAYPFVQSRGIVDEACNLPTSGCRNEMRDVN
jgi:hypothetical protein